MLVQRIAQTAGLANGATFPAGVTTITYTATDASSNTFSASFTVTVTDDEDPTITCAADQTATTDAGNCTAAVTVVAPTTADNCGVASVTNSFNGTADASGTYPIGITNVIWTVTDNSGNTATCSMSITVTDGEDPTITCAADQTQTTDAGSCDAAVTVVAPTITDNCGVPANGLRATTVSGAVEWVVLYGYDSANDRHRILIDGREFTAANPDTDPNELASLQLLDLYDGPVEILSVSEGSESWQQYYIPGNLTTAIANSSYGSGIIRDMNGDGSSYGIRAEFTFQSIGLTNDFNNTTDASGTYPLGTTTVTWTVTDNGGNTATCTQDITVTDGEDPTITCAADQTATADTGVCTAAVTVVAPTTADNCGVASVTNDFNNTADASGTYPVGTTTVVWTVTDNSGNTATCSMDITVTDDEDPTITCAADQTATTDAGNCTAAVTVVAPTTADNCGVASVTNSFNGTADASGTYPIGITNVIWTVTDNSGNTATCSMSITVTDGEDPTITCAADQTQTTDAGSCDAAVTVVAPTITDNCGVPANGLRATTVSGAVEWVVLYGYDSANDRHRILIDGREFTAANPDTDPNELASLQLLDLYDGPVEILSVSEGSESWQQYYIPGNLTTAIANSSYGSGIIRDMNGDGSSYGIRAEFTFQSIGLTNDFNNTTDASGTYPLGTTTVTWTVTDNGGNTATCTQDITVTDGEDPTITCAADQTATADTGVCTAAVTVVAPTTADNCGVASVTNDFNNTADASGTYPVGTTTVVWTVTDNSGNTATCSMDITVTDDEDPTITCAADQTATTDAGNCTAAVTVVAPTTADNCGVASVTNSFNGTADASGTYPIGITNVIWTVTDNSGNTATCSMSITVTDGEDPTITCAADQTQTTDAGSCDAAVTVVAPTITDNCGVPANGLRATTVSGAVEWVVLYGYDSANDRHRILIDGREFTAANPDTDPNELASLQLLDLYDGPVEILSVSEGSESWQQYYIPGNLTTAIANSSYGSGIIRDMNGDGSSYGIRAEFTFQSIGLTNDFNNTTDASGTYPLGTTTVTWTVTDNGGNTATCTQDITVTDGEDPTITCAADQTATADTGVCTAAVTVVAPTTADNCGVASVTNDFNNTADASGTYPVGTTTVVWTVTDNSGNTATCSMDITVTDDEDPTITCAADQTATTDAGNCTAAVTVVAPTTADNCGVASVTNNFNGTADASGTYPIGTTTVVWTVTDNSGKIATCSMDITVTDNEAPNAVCQDITASVDASGNLTITGDDVDGGSTDNCTGMTLSVSPNTFDCTDTGTTVTVTLTATDAAGLTDTCTANVTIIDQVAPTAVCQDITVQLDATGNVTITAADVDNGSSDACGGAVTLALTPSSSFDCDDLGANTVTLFVTDASGNSSFCTATVTVEDSVAPTITCAADQTQNLDAGLCTAAVTVVGPTISDNCSIASITNDFNSTADASDDYPLGTTTVTWTLTDGSGNTATCTQDIVVTDNQAPVAVCQDITVQLDATGAVTINASDLDGGSTDCSSMTFAVSPSSTFDCDDIGPNTVTLFVTDANGLIGFCSAVVTVEDSIDPTIVSIPGDIAVNNDSGACGAVVSWTEPTTTDNCSSTISQTTGVANGLEFPVGTTIVTYVATDTAGNTTQDTFTVTVTDVEAPTASCVASPLTVQLDASGVATITADDINDGSSDNCTAANALTLAIDISSFDCDDIGSTTVTLTVTDER